MLSPTMGTADDGGSTPSVYRFGREGAGGRSVCCKIRNWEYIDLTELLPAADVSVRFPLFLGCEVAPKEATDTDNRTVGASLHDLQ